MRLKEAIQHTSGLRCVVEGMEICSSVGRRMLHEMTWLGEESAITAEHDRIASVLRLLETEAGRDRTETIRRKLALLRDIRSTIERTGGNCVFDDIELFELKFFRAAGGRASTTGFARASCGTSRAERGRRSARSGRQPAPPFLRL